MSGPSVAVRVLGDTKNLNDEFGKTGTTAESAGSRIHGAFKSALSAINQTGVLGPFGAALEGIDQGITRITENGKRVGTVMMGIGATAIGLGASLTAVGDKDKAAQQQLQAAVEATGKSYDQFSGQVEEAVKKQEKYGHTADETKRALQTLTQATHDPAKALEYLSEASDLAAAKHEDLNTAAGQLGKAYNGNAKLIKEFGVEQVKSVGASKDAALATKDHEQTMRNLAGVLSGQATAATDTFTGKLKGIKAEVEDQVSQFGQKYGPAISTAGVALTGLGAAIEIASNSTKIFTGIQAAFNVVMDANPIILVVLALALLALGVYEAYKHIDVFREAVDAMGKVVAVIFKAILDAGKAVFGWVVANWPLLLGILAGPFGLAAALIYKYWDDIVAFFKAMPPKLASIFTGMWDGIWTGFKAVINFIIDAWNKLQFQTPSIDILGVHTPSANIGVPKIPRLDDGGAIVRSGLAIVHRGEVVVPPGAAGGGPAVVIQNATFENETDIEMFMRQAAWAVQTQAI